MTEKFFLNENVFETFYDDEVVSEYYLSYNKIIQLILKINNLQEILDYDKNIGTEINQFINTISKNYNTIKRDIANDVFLYIFLPDEILDPISVCLEIALLLKKNLFKIKKIIGEKKGPNFNSLVYIFPLNKDSLVKETISKEDEDYLNYLMRYCMNYSTIILHQEIARAAVLNFFVDPIKGEDNKIFYLSGKKEASYLNEISRKQIDYKIINRKSELNSIKEILNKVNKDCQNHGLINESASYAQVIGVKSKPGMGKSTLINEFLAHIKEDYTGDYYVNCSINRKCVGPYHPFISMLRNFFNIQQTGIEKKEAIDKINKKISQLNSNLDASEEKDLKKAANEILYLLGYKPVSIQRRTQDETFEENLKLVFQNFFSNFIKGNYERDKRPILIIFEDIHMYHKLSLNILQFLIRDFCIVTPIIFILTYQTNFDVSDLLQQPVKEITLKSFNSEFCKQMLKSYLPGVNFPNKVVAEIYKSSLGHPFFIKEHIHTLLDRHIIAYKNNNWEVEPHIMDIVFPNFLFAIIVERISLLDNELKQVLFAASIIGMYFSLEILKKIIDEKNDFENKLNNLITFKILEKSDIEYFFKHIYYHRATLSLIPANVKKELHLKIANVLISEYEKQCFHQELTIIAHLLKAERYEKSLPFLITKCKKTIQEKDYDRGLFLIKKGLSLTQMMPVHRSKIDFEFELNLLHSIILNLQAQYGEELALLEKMEAGTKDSEKLGRVYLQKSYHYLRLEKFSNSTGFSEKSEIEFNNTKIQNGIIESLYIQAKSLRKQWKLQEALQIQEKAFTLVKEENPFHYLFLIEKSIYFLLIENYQQALTIITSAIKQYWYKISRSIELKCMLLSATCYLKLGELENSENILKTAQLLVGFNIGEKNNFYFNYLYGCLLLSKGELKSAGYYLRTAYEIANYLDNDNLLMLPLLVELDFHLAKEKKYEISNLINKLLTVDIEKINENLLYEYKRIFLLNSIYSSKQDDLENSITEFRTILSKVDTYPDTELYFYAYYKFLDKNQLLKQKPNDYLERAHEILQRKLHKLTKIQKESIITYHGWYQEIIDEYKKSNDSKYKEKT